MNFIEDKDFNNYMEKFKQLNIQDKEEVIIKLLKEELAVLEQLLAHSGIQEKVLFNREILDVRESGYSTDDFLEAILVYIHSIRELIASYVELKEGGV